MPTKTRPSEPMATTQDRRPPDPTTSELAMAQAATPAAAQARTAAEERPIFEPPTSAAGAAASAALGWITNKHILMLWQTGGAMDNWSYLDGGVGWKRGTQTNDVAARGVGLLTAGARAGGGIVHVYDGAGGDIDAIYLW